MLLLLALLPAGARGQEGEPREDLDRIELAALLVRNGNHRRAASVLREVDPSKGGVDRSRYFFLKGVAELNVERYEAAAESLARAIDAAQTDEDDDPRPIMHVYRAQALFRAERFREALDAFARAPEKAAELPVTFAMRAQAHVELDEPEEAWSVLTRGLERHPEETELLRRKIFLAIERKLFQTAVDLGRVLAQQGGAELADHLAIGSALRRAGSLDEAARFIELAHLRFPDRAPLLVELARVHREQDRPRGAALLLERAALRSGDDDITLEAGELYREAGESYRALALNARVGDHRKRLRQRLSLLVDLEQYELVAAMARDLRRSGLLEEDRIRYALAYALFRVGDLDDAEALLSGIQDTDIFREATELRKAITDCREERWRC